MEGPPQLPSFRQDDRGFSRLERDQGSIPREKSPGGILGSLGAMGVVIVKFLPIILKSGGSMFAMIAVYGLLWGWRWAVGFVVLLLLHECGHLLAARHFGLKVSAPMFIPFMGAFIALKEAPRNAWIEAWIGIGGPLLGSAASLACHALGEQMNSPLLIGLAWTGYWLNLFNLVPLGQLDGGHIVTAISTWLMVPGLAVMGYLAYQGFIAHRFNFIILLILVLSVPRVLTLFRKRTREEERFYEVPSAKRWTMAFLYFGLMGALVLGMHFAELQLEARGISHGRAPVQAQ